MRRWMFLSVAMCCVGGGVSAQSDADRRADLGGSTTIGGEHPMLAAGARAIRAGRYEEGIELTLKGLESEPASNRVRAAALSNLCAAYAAKEEPERAIEYCTQSLALDSGSWRAYSNRSYAHWLKGEYAQASLDLDAAALIAPQAPQVVTIRGMINEATHEPRVVIEEHQ